MKFTPAYGNVYVAIKQDEEMGEQCRFQFMVRDTGIGISKEKIPFITDRFYQADNSTTRKYEGAGVGLALVKELIDLMNGRLEISSREGQGSEFSVEVRLQSATGKTGYPALIPFVEYSSVTANNIPGIQVIKEEEKFDKHFVLIAEDNVSLRDFLAESLLTKYQVITASNGEEAFQETLSTMPDVIISDVMMPVMDGFDFCEKVKNDPATSHIGFILLSAKATLESKLAGLKHGADDYLVKPFSVDELQSRIDSLLLRREKLRKHYLQQLISGNGFPSLNGIEDEFLQNTYKNIEDNLDNEHFTVEYLAEKMTLSQNILDRKLSTVIGLSANELIRQYRAKKTEMQKQMLELEAKALRAQMNPHFIFNCLNSIKSLIQEHDEDKAVTYLTTFSKLIRTLFNNADKKEITLFDEIETCKLYLQLEAMRFDAKFSYSINVENDIDLKSIQIPALIIQPFIENAIWHGIVPRNTGGHIVLDVAKKNDMIEVSVEDDGIGRESSKRNKSISSLAHKSKGVNLTQTRLELNNLLQQRQAMLEILDKKDENGVAMGTMVIIKITEEKL